MHELFIRLFARFVSFSHFRFGLFTAPMRRIRLFDLFPRRKVPRILAEAPRLLTCDDLEDRVRRTMECIRRVYPKETDESCLYALSEEPTLLFHLPDLKIFEERNRVDIAELPMTVQEQLVFATRNENE